jgi:hypothetical protein
MDKRGRLMESGRRVRAPFVLDSWARETGAGGATSQRAHSIPGRAHSPLAMSLASLARLVRCSEGAANSTGQASGRVQPGGGQVGTWGTSRTSEKRKTSVGYRLAVE